MKKNQELEKAAEKERKKAELAVLNAAKEAAKKVNPKEMFLHETDKYSAFDEKVRTFELSAAAFQLKLKFVLFFVRVFLPTTWMARKLVKGKLRNCRNFNKHRKRNTPSI